MLDNEDRKARTETVQCGPIGYKAAAYGHTAVPKGGV